MTVHQVAPSRAPETCHGRHVSHYTVNQAMVQKIDNEKKNHAQRSRRHHQLVRLGGQQNANTMTSNFKRASKHAPPQCLTWFMCFRQIKHAGLCVGPPLVNHFCQDAVYWNVVQEDLFVKNFAYNADNFHKAAECLEHVRSCEVPESTWTSNNPGLRH